MREKADQSAISEQLELGIDDLPAKLDVDSVSGCSFQVKTKELLPLYQIN